MPENYFSPSGGSAQCQPPSKWREGSWSRTSFSVKESWNSSRTWSQSSSRPAPAEQKKLIIAHTLLGRLVWHLPAVISCIVTAILLYLNLSGYVIGAEVGKDRQQTRNMLAALQLAAKAHELVIVSSIGNIARQWIQRCLINGGTLLGLIGVEYSLPYLYLLISREFWAAIGYCISVFRVSGSAGKEGRQRGKSLLLLLVFFFLACLVCSLSGPSSAILMIPRYDWFYETQIANYDLDRLSGGADIEQYPNILIDPLLGGLGDASRPDYVRGLTSYWKDLDKETLSKTHASHNYGSGYLPVSVNTTTSTNRAFDATWNGYTRFTSVMPLSTEGIRWHLSNYSSTARYNGAPTTFVADITGIDSQTVCRARERQSCDGGNMTDVDWCYLDVTQNFTDSQLRSSHDLLLIADQLDEPLTPPPHRVWMTEGRRIDVNPRFTDSIVVILERDSWLLVCSTMATLKTATAFSDSKVFSGKQADLHEYVAYYDVHSPTRYGSPRKLIYHENWLDSIHQTAITFRNASNGAQQITYPSRSLLSATEDFRLRDWAAGLLVSSYKWWTTVPQAMSNAAEVVVGGSFLSILHNLSPMVSQYTQSGRVYQATFYPPQLMPEPPVDYSMYISGPTRIYRQAYGFRLSTRTAIFGMVILLTHVLLVFLGSIKQCYEGAIISSWGSTPEYASLCLGSRSSSLDVIDNTCAGIGLSKTLSTVVRIRQIGGEHLELEVVDPDEVSLGEPVDLKKKYGSLGRRRRSGKVKRSRVGANRRKSSLDEFSQ